MELMKTFLLSISVALDTDTRHFLTVKITHLSNNCQSIWRVTHEEILFVLILYFRIIF